MLVTLMLMGCGSTDGQLVADPDTIPWGEIDFQEDKPEGGYNAQTITLTNTGTEDTVNATVVAFDFDHLCLDGFSSIPIEIPELNPGSSYVLTVGVCDYNRETGERDDVITGEIGIEHDGTNSPTVISWQFVPIEDLGDDTG